jgi:hypothetical protein
MTGRGWALLAALAALGCSQLEEPQRIPTAILHLYARTGQVGRPEALFLTAPPTEFPDSRLPTGGCQLTDLANLPVGTLSNLDAGDSVAFSSDLGTAYLYPKLDLAGNESYVPATALVGLTPGAAVTFAIPGATDGFPATTFSALTAPAITDLSTIPKTVSVSDSVIVTWAPAGDDSSAFEVALKYATEDAFVVNRQVLCQWRDAGRGVVPGYLLSEWPTANIRRIEVSRYRTFRQDLVGGGVLFFLATFDTLPEPGP